MRGRSGRKSGPIRLMGRCGLGLAAALLGIGVATAQDRAPTAPETPIAERFWVQERPLSGLPSSDLLSQDRRYLGGLGYGLNLLPPEGGSQNLALDPGAASSGLALDNW